MKTIYKYLFSILLLSSSFVALNAQALRSGYFSDSYLYRHQMNPAMDNTSNYFSIPIIGNMNVGFGSNIGIKDLIYKKEDGSGLTTFMNQEVSSSKFLGNLEDVSKVRFNLDMTLYSMGLQIGKGYYTLDINAHTRASLGLDIDLFRFMKETSGNTRYNIGDTRAAAMAYTEIALGHSREVIENLRVGMKLKMLMGLSYCNADLDNTYVDLAEDAWNIRLNGVLNMAAGGKFKTKDGSTEMSGYDDSSTGINGKGFAVDLGASYILPMVDGLKVSASLTDIGAIKWNCEQAAAKDKQFKFEGFNDIKIHSSKGTIDPATGKSGYYDGNLDEQWKRIEDDLENLYKFDVQAPVTLRERMGATANVGVEYELPVYRKVSFGALYSQRFSHDWGYAEGRLVANYAPSKIFDLSLSASAGTYGGSLGALANLHIPGFNFFVGFDQMYMKSFNSDMIPLEDGSFNVSFGFNVPLAFK